MTQEQAEALRDNSLESLARYAKFAETVSANMVESMRLIAEAKAPAMRAAEAQLRRIATDIEESFRRSAAHR